MKIKAIDKDMEDLLKKLLKKNEFEILKRIVESKGIFDVRRED